MFNEKLCFWFYWFYELVRYGSVKLENRPPNVEIVQCAIECEQKWRKEKMANSVKEVKCYGSGSQLDTTNKFLI